MESVAAISSAPALRAALKYHEEAAEGIRALLQFVTSFDPAVDPTRYAKMDVIDALELYLDERGGRATREECLNALRAGGIHRQRLEATLSTVITTNPSRVYERGGVVSLVRKPNQRAA